MTLLFHTQDDSYTRLGQLIFLSRYGLQKLNKSPRTDIRLLESREDRSEDPSIVGWTQMGERDIPLFDRPVNLEARGTPLLWFCDGSTRYPIAVRRGRCTEVSIDLFRQIGISLSGPIEKIWVGSRDARTRFLKTAFCDRIAEWAFSQVSNEYKSAGVPLVSKTFWPPPHRFAVFLSHDVDEVKKTTQWFTYPFRHIKAGNMAGLKGQIRSLIRQMKGIEPFWTFERIMEMEESLGVRSSWFFLQEKSRLKLFVRASWRHIGRRYSFEDRKVLRLIQSLDRGGWEIGLHGSFPSYRDFSLLAGEKSALEKVLGRTVEGCRQHNLNLDLPATWELQQRSGMRYDTTLGYNDAIGFRWGTSFPFAPHLPQEPGNTLLELPLTIQDLPFFRSGGNWPMFLSIADEVEGQQGLLTLLWHHPVFNNDEFPGWGDRYYEMIRNLSKRGAWIARGDSICHWWHRRGNLQVLEDFSDDRLLVRVAGGEGPYFLDVALPPSWDIREISKGTVMRREGNVWTLQGDTGTPNPALDVALERGEP
jgi:peptidoglycan/xylan/chitin deacetylase (PgdA/CDA1 family)